MKFKVGDIVVLTDPDYWVSDIIGAEAQIIKATSLHHYECRLIKPFGKWEEVITTSFPQHTVRLSETSNVQQLLDRYDD